MSLPPYVLLRSKRPRHYAWTLEAAKRPHDQQRFNLGNAGTSAVVRGPNGEAHYCGPYSYDQWIRDDERRKREARATAEDDAA